MQLYSNLRMTMENKMQATKAVEIIREIAAKKEPEYPEELNRYMDDIEVRDNLIVVEASCSLLGDAFFELNSDIMKACAVLTQASFEANAWHYSCSCGYSACMTAERNGDELEISTIISENGDATCPECGVTIVHYDEYDPNATYYCPECGEEMNHHEMFEGYLPEVKKEIITIRK